MQRMQKNFQACTQAEYIKSQNLAGIKMENLIRDLFSADAKLMLQDLKLLEKNLLILKKRFADIKTIVKSRFYKSNRCN